MCGRYTLVATPADLVLDFSLIHAEWFPPRYNIAPTQPIHIVRAEKGRRALALARWGLIPSWTRNVADLPLFFNARAETAPDKPAFRGPFRQRRCLIPATGFYEWAKMSGGRGQPYLIAAPSRRILAFAGLWDEYADDKGNIIDSAAILTTAANGDLAPIHDRMPVIINPNDHDRWLGLDPVERRECEALMAPMPDGFFQMTPVGSRVNTARHDDATLLERVEEPRAEAPSPRRRSKPRAAAPLDHAAAKEPDSAPEPRQLKLI